MTTNQNMPIIQKIKLDGTDLKLMFKASANLLEYNIEQINALNVFPVPDGDTGTNMFFTLQDSVSSMNETDSTSAAEVSRILSDTALKAAKGNSGVILSQFLQGFATGMDNYHNVLTYFQTTNVSRKYEKYSNRALLEY